MRIRIKNNEFQWFYQDFKNTYLKQMFNNFQSICIETFY